MKLAQQFKSKIVGLIHDFNSTKRKRRPMQLNVEEGVECLFRLIRTGMQWRELQVSSASYTTLFKHVHQWVARGIFQQAYAQLLQQYNRTQDGKYYIVDSSHVKNVYGRVGTGRCPVDRGRQGIKISVLTDCNGIVHNIRSDPANVSDFRLFAPMLSSALINLRRIEVFADKGYDSAYNRGVAYSNGFRPRIMRRRCRNSRLQNGKRVRVEHVFGWIDQCRRLRVQYEHHPVTHVAYTLFALGNLLARRFIPP